MDDKPTISLAAERKLRERDFAGRVTLARTAPRTSGSTGWKRTPARPR
jgi:hypothetical protein